MRRAVLLSALLACALVPVSAAQAARYKVGVSDQQATTFSNPLYAPLKLSIARYITPYDVMSDPAEHAKLDAWIKAATAARQRILISFEHSRKTGQGKKLPSVSAYTKAIKAFKKAYPKVKEISSWNEVNRCSVNLGNGHYEGQPTCNNPKRVAQYYMASRKVFKRARIVALDVLDENNPNKTIKFVKSFKKYAKPAPKYWGLHNYSDTNRGSTMRTKRIIAAMGKGEVWLTETGGIVRLGDSFPYNEERAAKALGCMFSIAKKYKQVKRLYIYQFNGAQDGARFDAGLVDFAGTSKRPGWAVVQQRKATGCHA